MKTLNTIFESLIKGNCHVVKNFTDNIPEEKFKYIKKGDIITMQVVFNKKTEVSIFNASDKPYENGNCWYFPYEYYYNTNNERFEKCSGDKDDIVTFWYEDDEEYVRYANPKEVRRFNNKMQNYIKKLNESLVKGNVNNTKTDIPYELHNIKVGFKLDGGDTEYAREKENNWNKTLSKSNKIKVLKIVNNCIMEHIYNKVDTEKNKIYVNFHNFEDAVDEDSGDVFECAIFFIWCNKSTVAKIFVDYTNNNYWFACGFINITVEEFNKYLKKFSK